MGDQSPAGTEAEQTNALVTRAGTEEVADEGRTAIVNETYNRDSSKKREWVLWNPAHVRVNASLVQ